MFKKKWLIAGFLLAMLSFPSIAIDKNVEKLSFLLPFGEYERPVLLNIGMGYAMPVTYFDSGLSNAGFSASAGIMGEYENFIHLGLDLSAILSIGNDDKYNMVEFALFFPLTIETGFNISIKDMIVVQPFAGAGVSLDILKTGDEDLYLAGEALRDDDEKLHFYIDPCFTAGIRIPLVKVRYNLTPYAMFSFYPGRDSDNDWETGSLLVTGLRVSI